MRSQIASFEDVGNGALVTFRDSEGFIAQVMLHREELQKLREKVDHQLWEMEQREIKSKKWMERK